MFIFFNNWYRKGCQIGDSHIPNIGFISLSSMHRVTLLSYYFQRPYYFFYWLIGLLLQTTRVM
ncbi:uncharacterized protein METZ01_LOCUS279569 [marine metagenome]|uniref:Uncharacterized protein n=1 Tax=marine metagenome TaxID=408172 RepID=A0A382KT16_9ZZZZ